LPSVFTDLTEILLELPEFSIDSDKKAFIIVIRKCAREHTAAEQTIWRERGERLFGKVFAL
jgi:hypothetical protein